MPAKKATKSTKTSAKAKKTVAKKAEKTVEAPKEVYVEPMVDDNGGDFVSGLLKFLIFLAVLDFLALAGVFVIKILLKVVG
tara:strand:+ start:989 stop:1231 length:243 start_codon:yes stop_codon:yes gene_type:complete